jgi:hypothetical protein
MTFDKYRLKREKGKAKREKAKFDRINLANEENNVIKSNANNLDYQKQFRNKINSQEKKEVT